MSPRLNPSTSTVFLERDGSSYSADFVGNLDRVVEVQPTRENLSGGQVPRAAERLMKRSRHIRHIRAVMLVNLRHHEGLRPSASKSSTPKKYPIFQSNA
jgi:hypothetical protein